MAGTLVVVLALIGTVLGGFCTDVTQATREVTNYEYVTDVTGLFDISPTPEYIAYNPGANYVGYTDNTINYTDFNGVNQYRYVRVPGSTTTTTKTVQYSDQYTSVTKFSPSDAGTSIFLLWNGSTYNFGSTVTNHGVTYNVSVAPGNPFSPYVTSFREILNSMNLTGQTATLTITQGSMPIMFTVAPWTFTNVERGDGDSQYVYSQVVNDANLPTDMTVDLATYSVTAYRNGVTLWSNVSADNIDVIYRYSTRASGSFQPASDCSATITATVIGYPTYGYADPDAGVTLASSPSTWANAYQNNEITITVAGQSAGSNVLTITTSTGSSVTITKSATGTMIVDLVLADSSTVTRVIGKWSAAQIKINATDGSLSLTPISGTPNYTTPVEENGTTYTWSEWYSGGAITQLTFSSTGTSLRWGITSTTVFLDTYGVVMQDPSITISDYFPELTEWRLNFYSFAVIGQSITINNQTYAIDPSTHQINIIVGEDEISGVIQNISISKIEGELWFTFEDTGDAINLGTAISDTISFDGRWYMTTGLYEVAVGLESYYDWNLDGKWHATGGQAIVMFLGLLSVGTIIAKGLYRISLKSFDGLILIMASLLSLIIGGMML